jgi:hypothetical protein
MVTKKRYRTKSRYISRGIALIIGTTLTNLHCTDEEVKSICMISGFCCEADENCALLRYYTASTGCVIT